MIHYITTTGTGDAWVANELNILRINKIPFVLHALRKTNRSYHSDKWAEEIESGVRCIYPINPIKFITHIILAPIIFKKRFFEALINAAFGERETPLTHLKSFFHFLVACYWAGCIRNEKVSHIHCQWAHSACTVGMYGAWLLGRTFSFTGHGSDIFQYPCALKDKIKRADFIVCISNFHRDYYKRLGARGENLFVIYCGIDVERFKPSPAIKKSNDEITIIATGRLVEKKGFRYLIDACKILVDKGTRFKCIVAGSGPLEKMLRQHVEDLKLDGFVELTGVPLLQSDIPKFMWTGDIYCLPSARSSDRDMDGLPQMLMEAMACGIPVVSTRLAGIPDLVVNDQTGLLVEPNDPQKLAEAIVNMKNNPAKSHRLAKAGREYVVNKFNISTSLIPLVRIFKDKLTQYGN